MPRPKKSPDEILNDSTPLATLDGSPPALPSPSLPAFPERTLVTDPSPVKAIGSGLFSRVDYSQANQHQFLLDIETGAHLIFDLHPSLLNKAVIQKIVWAAKENWPTLLRSDLRSLIEVAHFAKAIPLGSELRTQQILRFMDTLTTAIWTGVLGEAFLSQVPG